MAVVDGLEQIILHQVLSPADIDDHGAGHQFAEMLVIEDVPGFIGQRQGVHQNPCRLQEVGQVIRPGKGCDVIQ